MSFRSVTIACIGRFLYNEVGIRSRRQEILMMKRRDELLMKTLFLSSNGLNESTSDVFWKCIKKEPADTKVIYVPSAAVENDGAREGIALCAEGLMNMGIPFENILIYELSLLISADYERTYSGHVKNIPLPLRLMSVEELNQYDVIVFGGGDAARLLSEVRRTGFYDPLKQAIENGLVYLGISAGSMIAAGNFSNGLGYLTNQIIPHAEEGTPCGEVPSDKPIKTADGQVIVIQGDRKEIIC